MNSRPSEQELLELCKAKVAAKFTYTDFNNWVNNDFIKLSDDIVETTKSYLSPTSLKRIFGKISSEAFPKKTTLDILAQYIGYKDWNDFALQNKVYVSEQLVKEQDSSVSTTSFEYQPSKKSFKKIWVSVAVVLCLILGGFCYIFFATSPSRFDFKFTQLKSFDKAPFTASFKIDLPKKLPEEVVLDFSDPFETDLKFTNYKLTEASQTVAHTYMIPGVYHPHLRVNDKILDSLDVPVYSNGWEWVVVNYHEKDRAFFTIKDQPSFRKEGIFCVPSTEVAKYKVDTITGYCMRYMYYQNFKVNAENMKLEMKINNPVLSNKKCSNVEVQLKFMHWNLGFMLFHKGCNGNYSRVQLGSKVLNGVTNDLSMFEVDLNEWQKVLIEIKNGTMYITVNEAKLFEHKIEGDLGTFQGISLNSQESARLDYLKISSAEKVLLSEDF